ncbi:MAG: DUF881 domain-containing protein [Armatimonadota bacterium]|nr:DUF881 domain-containing protein [Armatimonadota bacterium]
MSVFPTVRSRTTWVLWVTALCLVLGGLVAASFKTQRTLRSRFGVTPAGRGGLVAALSLQADSNEELRDEIARLRKKNTEWEQRFVGGKSETQTLLNELHEARAFAGLVPLEGEGVVVTLQDNKSGLKGISPNLSPEATDEMKSAGLVHDSDIRLVIDELFAAGAEGVAVKDQRVVSRTAVRCVGPTILVNDVKMASPFIIKAIGNSKEILSALSMSGGLLDAELTALGMIKAEESKRVVLPAYSGSTQMRYSKGR